MSRACTRARRRGPALAAALGLRLRGSAALAALRSRPFAVQRLTRSVLSLRSEVPEVAEVAAASDGPMDVMTALQQVLKKSQAHFGLARGLREACKVRNGAARSGEAARRRGAFRRNPRP